MKTSRLLLDQTEIGQQLDKTIQEVENKERQKHGVTVYYASTSKGIQQIASLSRTQYPYRISAKYAEDGNRAIDIMIQEIRKQMELSSQTITVLHKRVERIN
ncbi:hypothetical protein [Domibacillus epiphyticus]|uniref:Uncharacterized protein n=1 Tax=Domibacillus epiphyticus TaxID=1714355 RepID=A0A1V2A3N4_9BACI|nr:hypothetical protein [Domibacillus epiphyticus]OMP65626.1 hypothetical protein BTO28_16515 [Domibacillus epiphyticus]